MPISRRSTAIDKNAQLQLYQADLNLRERVAIGAVASIKVTLAIDQDRGI
jgi:hypothetical protein